MESNEEKKAEQPANNIREGDKPQEFNLVERARQERERLAEENERLERNIKELRELEASRLLGSTAGGRVETQPAAETPQEYAKRISQGKV